MKICLLCLNLYLFGGIQRVLPEILNPIAETDDVTVIMPFSDTDKNIFGLSKRIKIVNLKKFPKHNKYTLCGAFSLAVWKANRRLGFLDNQIGACLARSLVFSKKQKRMLINFLNSLNFDVIIGVSDYYSLLLSQISPYLSAKTVGWEHNTFESYFDLKGRNSYGLKTLFKKEMVNLDRLLVLTKADREKYEQAFKTKTITLYNPVSFKVSSVEPQIDNDLIFVGRLHQYQKGLDFLTEIISQIVKIRPQMRIMVIGDGPDRDKFEQELLNRNLFSNVDMVGMSSCVEKYYRKASVFLHTSRYEGFGVVIVEAMAHGVPVVAFHNNGPDEIITDGIDGFLIDQYNIKEFSERVIQLLDDKALYSNLSNNAKKRSADFSSEKISLQFKNILQELIAE